MRDTGESFRGGIHFVMGGLALALGLYNVMRFVESRGSAHAINATAYTLLVGLEIVNTHHHWSKAE